MEQNFKKAEKLVRDTETLLDKVVAENVSFEKLGSGSTKDFKKYKKMVQLWKESKEYSLSLAKQLDEQSEMLDKIDKKMDAIQRKLEIIRTGHMPVKNETLNFD